jgi:hypothetical protein
MSKINPTPRDVDKDTDRDVRMCVCNGRGPRPPQNNNTDLFHHNPKLTSLAKTFEAAKGHSVAVHSVGIFSHVVMRSECTYIYRTIH